MATAAEITEIVGPLDDAVLVRIARDSSPRAQSRVCAARLAPDSPLEEDGLEPAVLLPEGQRFSSLHFQFDNSPSRARPVPSGQGPPVRVPFRPSLSTGIRPIFSRFGDPGA
jgi:hypothetical protein